MSKELLRAIEAATGRSKYRSVIKQPSKFEMVITADADENEHKIVLNVVKPTNVPTEEICGYVLKNGQVYMLKVAEEALEDEIVRLNKMKEEVTEKSKTTNNKKEEIMNSIVKKEMEKKIADLEAKLAEKEKELAAFGKEKQNANSEEKSTLQQYVEELKHSIKYLPGAFAEAAKKELAAAKARLEATA